jgi:hypothetical protein
MIWRRGTGAGGVRDYSVVQVRPMVRKLCRSQNWSAFDSWLSVWPSKSESDDTAVFRLGQHPLDLHRLQVKQGRKLPAGCWVASARSASPKITTCL